MNTAAFQRAFVDTLAAPVQEIGAAAPVGAASTDLDSLATQPGIAVHRNNVMVACIDALAAIFPSIALLVGDDFFRSTAAEFARGQLPERPSLYEYGASFADFLARFPPAAALPYLADVAR